MKAMPSDAELFDRLMGRLHATLSPLHGKEIDAAMKSEVDLVITKYFEELDRQGLISKPYPRWRLVERDDGLQVDFHELDMQRWMATHPAPKGPTR